VAASLPRQQAVILSSGVFGCRNPRFSSIRASKVLRHRTTRPPHSARFNKFSFACNYNRWPSSHNYQTTASDRALLLLENYIHQAISKQFLCPFPGHICQELLSLCERPTKAGVNGPSAVIWFSVAHLACLSIPHLPENFVRYFQFRSPSSAPSFLAWCACERPPSAPRTMPLKSGWFSNQCPLLSSFS
jgi:hypothetical protein